MKPSVTITKGSSGWGGPLTVYETETRKVVASVTGGSIHPLAEKIASLLGVPVVDAFNNKVEPDTIIIAVVDCGGGTPRGPWDTPVRFLSENGSKDHRYPPHLPVRAAQQIYQRR